MRKLRGMTLIELTVVLAIAGILAALAAPALGDTARGFRSKALAEDVIAAVRQGRTLAIKLNEPSRLVAEAGRLVLQRPTYSAPPDGYLVSVDVTEWVNVRTMHLPDIKFTDFPTEGFVFCPSGEARYRRDSLDGPPLCPLGDLVAPEGLLRFEAADVKYAIELRGAVGSARLRLDR